MRSSVVITVINEERSIAGLIESLLIQTKRPEEIIIVDGGSTDNTLRIISELEVPNPTQLKLSVYRKQGYSIAQGRNYGVSKAAGSIIAMTDAGCVAKIDWLENLMMPFMKQKTDVVAGFYHMTGKTAFQKVLSRYIGVLPNYYNESRFLPSTRSIAFTKSIWREVGRFNEAIDRAGEDTLFHYQLVKHHANIIRAKKALVYWEMPGSVKEAAKKFFVYAVGDVQAGIFLHPVQKESTHLLKIISIFVRYFFFLSLMILLFSSPYLFFFLFLSVSVYVIWSWYKVRIFLPALGVFFWAPVVQIVSDIAVMVGVIAGLVKHGTR